MTKHVYSKQKLPNTKDAVRKINHAFYYQARIITVFVNLSRDLKHSFLSTMSSLHTYTTPFRNASDIPSFQQQLHHLSSPAIPHRHQFTYLVGGVGKLAGGGGKAGGGCANCGGAPTPGGAGNEGGGACFRFAQSSC